MLYVVVFQLIFDDLEILEIEKHVSQLISSFIALIIVNIRSTLTNILQSDLYYLLRFVIRLRKTLSFLCNMFPTFQGI